MAAAWRNAARATMPNTDIAAARAIRPNIMVEYQGYGLMPPLTEAPARATEPAVRDDAQAKAPPRSKRN